MSRIPVLIGIIGPQSFSLEDTENQRLRDALSARLEILFAKFDTDYAETPKVLVCSGAPGTDILAIRAALKPGRDWKLALILPFERALLEEDYALGAAGESDLSTLRETLGRSDGRVLVKCLPPVPLDAGGTPSVAQLSRSSPSFDASIRAAQYEQAGLWIGDAATVLVGVSPSGGPGDRLSAERAERIVEARRVGRPGPVGREVANRSRVLRRAHTGIHGLVGRPVWSVDPASPPPAGDWGAVNRDADHGPDPVDHHAAPSANRFDTALLRAFKQFNGGQKADDVPLPTDPIEAIQALRDHLSSRTATAKRWSVSAFVALAVLFWVAILIFEVYAKFAPDNAGVLLGYLGVMALIAFVVLIGRTRRLQARAEDYRAASELLRIQRAWWAAGLEHRVDREHLQGADRDLAPVRDAVASILSWIWLRGPWPTDRPTLPDGRALHVWSVIRTPGVGKAIKGGNWIGSQIDYFRRRFHQQEQRTQTVESVSWFMVVTAALLAAVLAAWIGLPGVKHTMHGIAAGLTAKLSAAGAAALLVAAVVGTGIARFFTRSATGRGATAWTFGLAMVAAPLVALAAWCVSLGLSSDPAAKAKYGAIVLVVVITAAAGALRYLAEKLGWEAEALQYREALGWFGRARAALDAVWPEGADRPSDEPAAREIVLELGRLALSENESWLKTRRERPLTPVAG